MTSAAPTSSTPNNSAQTASGASSVASGTPPARSSYANATKSKPSGPPPIASSTPAIVGGSTQHGNSGNGPVNGNSASNAGAPAIVSSGSISNGSASNGNTQNPSAVTISAQGATYTPNGGSGAQNVRNSGIHFGAMSATGSPAPAHSVPQNVQGNNLGTPANTSTPARSPSPIPPAQPVVSGGRPPSASQGQATNLSFGNLGGSENMEQGHRTPLPSGPANLAQSQHYRRESSQSQHGEMGSPMNRNFTPNGGRGRGYPNYPNSGSPQVFRPSPAMPPRNLSNVAPFQPQGGMRGAPGSPYASNRSPALQAAQMHPQQHMPNGQPMPYYGGHPGHHLNAQANPVYGMPPQEYYQGYYGQPYMAPHGMPNYHGAPPSPRFQNAAHGPPQGGYMPAPYHPPAQSMSRQSSHQGSDRPPSTAPHSTTPSISAAQGPPPIVSSGSPAPTNRSEPRKSKAIVIKNADGEVLDLKNIQTGAPAPVQSRPPAVVSSGAGVPSTSTPPPRPTTSDSSNSRNTDSQPPRSSEETKRIFAEQFKRQLEAEKATKDAAAAGEKAEPTEKKESEPAKPAEAPAKPVEESAKSVPEAAKEEPAKAEEEDDDEAWIRELEEQERIEEEREKAYQAKKAEENAKKEKEAKAKADEELKKAEREAEAREEAKLQGKGDGESAESKAEAAKLFASLKRPTLGPGATGEADASAEASSPSTPSEQMPPPAVNAAASRNTLPSRHKPSMLKLETAKAVEPAQPTAGMQSLRSARFLQLQKEDNIYPEGIRSPNPALNKGAKSRGRQYDKDFLMQFQEVFKEKPSVDWDKMLKDTVGDGSDSARPSSARTPSMGGRQNSRNASAAMGSFQIGSRTLAPGTTSEQRFAASNSSSRPAAPFNNPLAQFAGGRGGMNFPMGGMGQSVSRSGSSRGPGGSIGAQRQGSARNNSHRKGNTAQEAQMAKTMPLTAGKDLKPLEVSKTGWKPASIVAPSTVNPGVDHLTPELVQRKVKSHLNKMTPQNFEKISGEILLIAAQSKDETDGRTLRQVIQLTFEKACDEAHWASMYAKFCKRMLETMSPDIKDDNVKDKNGNPIVGGALFRKYLLNRCQEEFERGWEVNLPTKPEGGNEEAVMLSDEYYIAAAAKRRGLGLIQFIGELYKLGMLTIRIMHECVFKLLNFEGVPEESTVESLVKLLRTIGATMESNKPTGSEMIKVYFDRIDNIMQLKDLNSRLYYMLLDTVELRKKGWQSKDADKGPKTIQEIHEEAARKQAAADAERQRTARAGGGRPPAGRGDARSFSHMGGPPPDFNRNQVGIDDLKKLTRGTRNNTGASLGPSMLGSRSGSRRGLGPARNDDSGPSSRTGTPPVKEKAAANAFAALAGLDGGDDNNEVTSPPSTSSSPALAKSTPAAQAGEDSKA